MSPQPPWWSRHWPWIGLSLVGYGVTLLLFWYSGHGGQWPAATTAYFAAIGFVVLWWYAASTRELLETSRHQVVASQAQHAHALRLFRIAHKPFAVVERVEEHSGYHYYLRNIGHGLAVNVWSIEESPEGRPIKQPLGALGLQSSRVLYGELERWLRDQPGLRPFVLLAEGLRTRTAQWTATINWRQRIKGGEMHSQPLPIRQTRRPRTIEQVVADDWEAIRRALRDAGAGE